MKTRPTGITILALIYIALAALSLLWSLTVFGFGGLAATFGSLFGAQSIATTGVNSVVSGTLGIITAIVELIVAFGLWKLRPWAWLLAIIAIGLNVVGGVLGMFSGGLWTFCCGVFGLIIPAAILIYLLRPHVRQAFGR
ncbi:MAG: hypothetical protein WA040_18645 [Anaerolineae bacterium]